MEQLCWLILTVIDSTFWYKIYSGKVFDIVSYPVIMLVL